MLGMVSQNVNSLVVSDVVLTPEIEDDDLISLEGDPIVDSSLSIANENNSFCRDEFINSKVFADLVTRSSIEIDKSIATVNIIARATDLGVSNIVADVAVSLEEETGVRSGQIPLQVFFSQGKIHALVAIICHLRATMTIIDSKEMYCLLPETFVYFIRYYIIN